MKKMSRTKKAILGLLLVPTLMFGGAAVSHVAGGGGSTGDVVIISGKVNEYEGQHRIVASAEGVSVFRKGSFDTYAGSGTGKGGDVPVTPGVAGDPSQWGLSAGSYVVAEASNAGGGGTGDVVIIG